MRTGKQMKQVRGKEKVHKLESRSAASLMSDVRSGCHCQTSRGWLTDCPAKRGRDLCQGDKAGRIASQSASLTLYPGCLGYPSYTVRSGGLSLTPAVSRYAEVYIIVLR